MNSKEPCSLKQASGTATPHVRGTTKHTQRNSKTNRTHKPNGTAKFTGLTHAKYSPCAATRALKHRKRPLSKRLSSPPKQRSSSKEATPRNWVLSHKRRASATAQEPHVKSPRSAQTLPLIAKFSHKTRKGMIPGSPEKPNQDSYIECVNQGPQSDTYIFGVCDGHGYYGKQVSTFVKRRLPALLSQHPQFPGNIRKSLADSIVRCNTELSETELDIKFSGTTLVLVVIKGNKLWCANVGDSRAVLARQSDGAKQ